MATVTRFVGFRLTPEGDERLDELAALLGVNRSVALRRLLSAPLSSLALLTTTLPESQKETAVLRQTGRAAACGQHSKDVTPNAIYDFTPIG